MNNTNKNPKSAALVEKIQPYNKSYMEVDIKYLK